MRIFGPVTALLLLFAALSGAAAGMGQGCASAGRTVIASSVARLYDQSDRVYGCWLPTGRRLRLDTPRSRWRLANVKGPYVAVAFDRTHAHDVIVWAKVGPDPERRRAYMFPEPSSGPPAVQLYVSKRGAVAFSTRTTIGYIAPITHGGGPRYTELDSGPGVSARSLWANERTGRLMWTNAGVRKSARWR
jgi:hypothetical protein